MIPVIVGLCLGFFLLNNNSNIDQEYSLFTKETLMKNSSPIKGNENAGITILEFGDYQCTFCHKFHQHTLDDVIKLYVKTDKINFAYKDFPLNGTDSVLAAEASFCADDQEKYWEYHNMLFQNWAGEKTGWITGKSLLGFAKKIGLDQEQFIECMNSHKYNQKVIDNANFAKSVGINATPSFLIFTDERLIRIVGAQPLEKFTDAIEQLN